MAIKYLHLVNSQPHFAAEIRRLAIRYTRKPTQIHICIHVQAAVVLGDTGEILAR